MSVKANTALINSFALLKNNLMPIWKIKTINVATL